MGRVGRRENPAAIALVHIRMKCISAVDTWTVSYRLGRRRKGENYINRKLAALIG
jgi:hypothetical protein